LREQYLTFRRYEVEAGQRFRCGVSIIGGFRVIREIMSSGKKPDFTKIPRNTFLFDSESGERLPLDEYISVSQLGAMNVRDFDMLRDRDTVVYQVDIHTDMYHDGGSNMANYLSAETTNKFIELTYDKYFEEFGEYFGGTLKAFFNDESRMCKAFPWSSDFAQEFISRKGYDIRFKLCDLIMEGSGAGRTRVDYFDVVASLYQENYFGRIRKWCEAHDTALCAHLLSEETLVGHTRFSGDFMRQLKELTWPGTDHLGKGIGSLNIKFGASAAHNYGKTNYNCEVFAGCGWDMTFEEYIRIISWLYLQGVQIIINHGFFYSDRDERKNDWPPSQFFQWKHWDRVKEGNDMCRRLYHGFTGGRHEAETLIYLPIESFWLHYIGQDSYKTGFANGPLTLDKQAAEIDAEYQKLLTGLQEQNIDFDVLNADALGNFRAEDGEIINTLNGERFNTFILPFCEVMHIETARVLNNFVLGGGKLMIIDGYPTFAVNEADDDELRVIVDEWKVNETVELYSKSDSLGGLADRINSVSNPPIRIVRGLGKNANNHRNYPEWLIDPYFHEGEDITGIMYARYIKDGFRNTYFVNFGAKPETISVFARCSDEPQVWDTLTGTIQKPALKKCDGGYIVDLELPAGYGIFLVSDNR